MAKSIVVSFRMTEAEIEPFNDAIAASKNRSAFFKELVLTTSSEKAATNLLKGTDEYTKYNFLLYKASNNINQIAKTLNTLAKSNFTDLSGLNKALNNIHSLEQTIKSKLL